MAYIFLQIFSNTCCGDQEPQLFSFLLEFELCYCYQNFAWLKKNYGYKISQNICMRSTTI